MVDDPAATAFQRHYAQVVRYLRRHTGSQDEAEDLAQAVFVEAAAHLQRVPRADGSVLAWLYIVAQRRLADRARAARRRARSLAALDADRLEPVEERAYGPSVAGALRDAIARLPESQRRVVVMKLLEGRSFAEIAERVGATEAACKMRLARGLESVRDELAALGIEP